MEQGFREEGDDAGLELLISRVAGCHGCVDATADGGEVATGMCVISFRIGCVQTHVDSLQAGSGKCISVFGE